MISIKVLTLIASACAPYQHHNVHGINTNNGIIWDSGTDARKTCEEVYKDCVRYVTFKKCDTGVFYFPNDKSSPWSIKNIINTTFDIETYAPLKFREDYKRDHYMLWRKKK